MKVALVVDDSEPVRTVVADALRGAGMLVLEAATTDEALAIVASREDLAIAISDLSLDGQVSGVTLLNQALRLRPSLKCVLMSGSMLPGQKMRTPFPIISKPFPPQALVELVERLLV
jgi:DNA-binding NtrC family response regulator